VDPLADMLQEESLPARGEWIEINKAEAELIKTESLSPHGESGLKLAKSFIISWI